MTNVRLLLLWKRRRNIQVFQTLFYRTVHTLPPWRSRVLHRIPSIGMQIKSFRVFPPKVGHGFYRQEIVIGKIRVQPIAVETKVVGGFGKLVRQITNRHSICRKVLSRKMRRQTLSWKSWYSASLLTLSLWLPLILVVVVVVVVRLLLQKMGDINRNTDPLVKRRP